MPFVNSSEQNSKRCLIKRLITLALAACMLLSSGCSIASKVVRTVKRLIAPVETATPVPSDTDWFDDETTGPKPTDHWQDTPEQAETQEPGDPTAPPPADTATYFDIREFNGSQNVRSTIPVSWQRGSSILQSEVMALDISMVLWPVGFDSQTMATETDINGDGADEGIWIETDGNMTLQGIFLSQGNTTVNLLSLVSSHFWDTISPIMDRDGTFAADCVLQADCLDLDNDGIKEILIAAGNNNDILAVSVLAYSGGQYLYREVGGIIGHKLLFISEEVTMYVPYGNSQNGEYVEFGYRNEEFGWIGYNMGETIG